MQQADTKHTVIQRHTLASHRQLEALEPFASIFKDEFTETKYKTLLVTLYRFFARPITAIQSNTQLAFISPALTTALTNLQEDLWFHRVNLVEITQLADTTKSYIDHVAWAYVILGSSLGGRIIAKQLKNLPYAVSATYFNDTTLISVWQPFLRYLEQSPIEADELAKAANNVFQCLTQQSEPK